MRAIAALFLALMATATLAGEVYTWRDASGKVHYSDTPPPRVDARKMRDVTPEDSGAAQRRSLADQEMEFRKRRTETEQKREKAEKETAAAAERERNCEQARTQLQALESGQRMIRFNAAGERIVLDDEARAQETANARKAVQDWCR